MKVFLDSSVLIAALLSDTGGSAKILTLGEAGILDIYISLEVIDEVNDVLERKFVDAKPLFKQLISNKWFHKISLKSPLQIREAAEWIKDPKDAKILAGAKQANVDYLITLDISDFIRDLQVAKKSGLRIFTPGDFLQEIFPVG